MTPLRPLRLARALLRRGLPADIREDTSADLEELFLRRVQRQGQWRAQLWFAGQVLSFAARFAWEGVRQRGGRAQPSTPASPARSPSATFGISSLDFKLGFRVLVKNPGLSLVGVLALAAAIGTGAAWFEAAMMELYPKLPFEDGERLVRIESWDAEKLELEPRLLSDFLAWKSELASIEQLGAARTVERNLIGPDGRAQLVPMAEISASAFPLTRVPPLLGRTLLESDERPGAPDVVLLGYGLWLNGFAADSGVVGRVVQLGRGTATVVGVMPEGFAFPRSHSAWVPLRAAEALPRTGPAIQIFGRLAEGATLRAAQAELTAVGERTAAASPDTHARLAPSVTGFAATSTPIGRPFVAALVNLAALLVLVAAAGNVATLMFARTAMREAELVVRGALGASRRRIIGQLFVEALVLAAVAAAVGLTGAGVVFRLMWERVWEAQAPFWWDGALEPSTIVFALVMAVVGAALTALLPALKATSPRVQQSLQRISSGGTRMRFGGIWSVIIVLQVALTVICLPVGVALSLDALRTHQVRATFPSEEYLTLSLQLDPDAISAAPGGGSGAEFSQWLGALYDELEGELAKEPGVAGVTFAAALPGAWHSRRRIHVQRGAGSPVPMTAGGGGVGSWSVATDFFGTFRVPLVAGRGFHAGDLGVEEGGAVVVNEAFAESLGGSPLGVRIRYGSPASIDAPGGTWYEVVGVVQNLGMDPMDQAQGAGGRERPFVFHPATPAEAYPTAVAVHVRGDPAALAARVRSVAMEIDPALLLKDLEPLDVAIRRRDLAGILASLSATGVVLLTLLLSAAGLFALMAVAVARRTREIGIRLALGASWQGVLAALFARSAQQLGIGILLGNLVIGGTLWTMKVRETSQILLALLAISALMALVGLVACTVPARRALRIHPTQALRE